MAPPAAPSPSLLAKLNTPAKIGIGAGFVVALGAGYWLMFYSDVANKIEQETRQKAALQSELSQQKQALATYFADRDELALRTQRQREFNKVLPADSQIAAYLSSLQQVSNASGVDLKSWQPLEEQSAQFYVKVPMKLEMRGKFHQIVKFAHEAGKQDRIINIENIKLTEPKVVGDEVFLTATCLATAFHAIVKAQPKPAGAPK